MATKTNDAQLFDVDGALKQWTEATRKAAENGIELYLKTVEEIAGAELEVARATKVPVLVSLTESHVAAGRELAGTYASAARDLLKA